MSTPSAPSSMPAVFLGHGSPMNALDRNRYTEAWRQLGERMPRPQAILAISAHWYTPGATGITAMAAPPTIHDFGNFPRALFEVQYPAPGDPAIARRVRELLAPVTDVRLDQDWGLDHGTWSVLVHMYPEADIPVLQLSMNASKPNSWHYELGRHLAPLRDQGILIAGFGNVVHNLRAARWGEGAQAHDWAVRFEAQVRDLVERREHEPLLDYAELGDHARLSVPTPEHFLPLLYVLGAQRDAEPLQVFAEGIDLGSVSMLSVVVGH